MGTIFSLRLNLVINELHCITTQATPTQLAFGRDALLNISFEADWQYIKKRKQHRITQNNKAENATRRDPSRKLKGKRWIGPHTVTQVFEDNGTLQLTRNVSASCL